MRPAVLATRARSLITPVRLLTVLVAALLVFGPASLTRPYAARAATVLGTTTYTSDTTWTTAGSPYILNGNVTVSAGVTLTVQPGVIVKFNGQFRTLTVSGTLSAVGTSGSPITFTSYEDDTAGGDSNGDGAATSGDPGEWTAISVNSGGTVDLKFANVRYGGWGTSNTGAGALDVRGTATVEDATFSNNQRSAIKTGASGTFGGAVVRRTTIASNGNGISANEGWVSVSDTLIRDSADDGMWFNLTNSYTGPTSTLMDSEIRSSGDDGITVVSGTSLSATYWPRGSRNNIYSNNGLQFETAVTRRTVDWSNNYWGSAGFWNNDARCHSAGENSIGRLFNISGQGSPPPGPISSTFYTVPNPTASCYYDRINVGRLAYSPFKLRVGPWMSVAQSLGTRVARNKTRRRADPVNTATGSFTYEVADVSLPGIGVSFAFVRSYNSIDPTSGPFGQGWTHSYNALLTIKANGDVTARAGDGQQLEFVRNSDGSYSAAAGGEATLTSVTGGYELKTFDQELMRFDTSGRLTSQVDRNNKGLTFAYDGSGRLSTVTDASNRQATLTYNGSGLLSQIASPGGNVSYGYTDGRLTSVTDIAGKVWAYIYEAHGFLEKEIDPIQHTVIRNVYGDDGRVIEQYDALNNKTTFSWDAATQTQTITDARDNVWKDVYASNVLQKEIDATAKETQYTTDSALTDTAITGPDNKTTTMSYDSRGNLLQAVAPSPLSVTKTFVYNSQNDVASVTDGRGKVTTYAYDANGNNTSIVQDGVTVATYAYNANGQVTSFTNGRNYTTTYTYEANGNLESETDHLGNKTTYTYDSAGRVLSRVDPRGNVQGANPNDYRWTYTYNTRGQVLTETTPLGHTTTYAYDDAGNRTSFTDPNNKTTTYTYDAGDRLLTVTAPDTGVTTYTYDAVGNKLAEKNALNKTTTHTYDANNRLASSTTPLGNKTTYFYDVNGNLIKQVEPRGNVTGANPDNYATTFTYDAAGRVLTETDPLGNTTTYTYDAVGNQATVKDANNYTTSYTYDGLNRLTKVTAPGGAETTYTYDAAGNPLTHTDARNNTTTFVYDAANRLISVTRPLSRQWTYAYDADGNRTNVTDANGNATQTSGDGTTTYTFDRSGRLTGINYSDSTPDVTYSLDGANNRTQMTDGAGTETYVYDNVNRMTSVTRGTDTFSYNYDLAGNVTRRTYPDSTIVDYSYDDDTRLTGVTSGGNATAYTYDAAGNLTATTLPASNGHVEEQTYDAAGRLSRVKSVKSGTTLVDFSYTLDAVGNPTQVVRAGSAPGTTTYAYDNRNRLTEVCFQVACPGGGDPFIRWTYDSVGNRLSEVRPSGTTNYTYNAADELTQAGAMSYTYDANGNQTAAGTRAFSYDLANRLASTTSGGTTTYSYDGDGNRLAAVGAVTVRYVWDMSHGLPELALERDGGGTVIRRNVHGHRQISATTSGVVSYFHHDGVGSVANLTSGSGAKQWTYAYEPFGTTRTETQDDPAAPTNPMKFAGEQLDETGLYHLRARQYDPQSGRFLGLDPLEPSQQEPLLSEYIYANDRPTVLADPSGMGAIRAGSGGPDAVRIIVTPTVRPDGGCLVVSLPQREQCAFRFFRDRGLTLAQSSGVVANFWYESGRDLNPTQWEFRCKPRQRRWNDDNCGFGIAQWTKAVRKLGLIAFAGGLSAAHDFGIQLQYAWYELTVKTDHLPWGRNALRELKNVGGATPFAARTATEKFMRGFEGPNEDEAELPVRKSRAALYFLRFRT